MVIESMVLYGVLAVLFMAVALRTLVHAYVSRRDYSGSFDVRAVEEVPAPRQRLKKAA